MTYFWLPIGLLLPTFSGWCILRVIEGKTPVLFRWERIIAGMSIGIVGTMFDTFILHILGIINLSFVGMLIVQLLGALIIGGAYFMLRSQYGPSPTMTKGSLLPWQKVLAGIFGLWLAVKLIAGFIFLIGPPYYDDVMSNWNMRGKAFFVQEELILEIVPEKGTGISSYPQSVPMFKTWLAHLSGEWHEGLVNSIHIVWYVSILALLFFALRRMVKLPWALLGVYVLSSIPLFTMHGIVAYVDLYLSLLLFLSLSFLYFATLYDGEKRLSFLRLGALVTSLLIFTKNEALLLHVPPIVALVGATLFFASFSAKERKTTIAWYGGCIAMVLIPWLAFKWYNDLAFGNAKDISGLTLQWHEGVIRAIGINTLLQGNWIVLPVLFVGLCIARWRSVLFTPLSILFGFVAMVWLGQLPIYMFTDLYIEALNQTGYARGIIHLVPIVVMITTLLLNNILRRKTE